MLYSIMTCKFPIWTKDWDYDICTYICTCYYISFKYGGESIKFIQCNSFNLCLPSGIKLGHGPWALYTNGHRSCKENSKKLHT